jgi:hypothetical protein
VIVMATFLISFVVVVGTLFNGDKKYNDWPPPTAMLSFVLSAGFLAVMATIRNAALAPAVVEAADLVEAVPPLVDHLSSWTPPAAASKRPLVTYGGKDGAS